MVPEDLRVWKVGRVARLLEDLGVSEEEVVVLDEVVGTEELELLVLGAVGFATEGTGVEKVGVERMVEVELEDCVEAMAKASGMLSVLGIELSTKPISCVPLELSGRCKDEDSKSLLQSFMCARLIQRELVTRKDVV